MNHFTPLEYTQRLGQAELGRRVIYRDAYMSGWAYKTCQPEDLRVPVVAGEGKRVSQSFLCLWTVIVNKRSVNPVFVIINSKIFPEFGFTESSPCHHRSYKRTGRPRVMLHHQQNAYKTILIFSGRGSSYFIQTRFIYLSEL